MLSKNKRNLPVFLLLILTIFLFSVGIMPSETEKTPKESQVLSSTDFKDGQLYKVSRVIDGDTLEIENNGSFQKIRLIGVDTPETSDPRKEIECFGVEASNKSKELLEGKQIRLESDPTQQNKDRYERLLRYIYLEDGTNINLYLIAEGYAHEYTYDKPYEQQVEFIKAEDDARKQENGLWNNSICNYE